MSSDDRHGVSAGADLDGLGALELEALLARVEALDLRVRCGAATLEDFGALARARSELARRTALGRRAGSRGAPLPD